MTKRTALLLSALLAFGGISTAQADWRHGGYDRHDYRPPMHHHHGHRHGGVSWVGPAAALAITGIAIGAATYGRAYAAPAPVYTAPPPPSNSMWYYCGSSGQYYPYTNACPEGWQPVPAR